MNTCEVFAYSTYYTTHDLNPILLVLLVGMAVVAIAAAFYFRQK